VPTCQPLSCGTLRLCSRGVARLAAGHPRQRRLGAGRDPDAGRVTADLQFAATSGADAKRREYSDPDGALLAYGAAQVVGSLPIVPGGIGIIEGSLAVILMQYGAGRVRALSATLVYRIVSFWLDITIGWITVHRGLVKRPS
jgi:hypothetical protein